MEGTIACNRSMLLLLSNGSCFHNGEGGVKIGEEGGSGHKRVEVRWRSKKGGSTQTQHVAANVIGPIPPNATLPLAFLQCV